VPVASTRPDQNPGAVASQSGPERPWPTANGRTVEGTTENPRFRKSGAVGEVIKAFVAGARVLAGCCCRMGAGVPIFPPSFSATALGQGLALGSGPRDARESKHRRLEANNNFPL